MVEGLGVMVVDEGSDDVSVGSTDGGCIECGEIVLLLAGRWLHASDHSITTFATGT